MVRAPCCEKMGLKKGPWTPEEDQILISYIQKHGHGNWRALPKQAGLLRCGKSCRLRWINYLRPDIKRGNFTSDEEETIIKLHEMLGNRWSAIAAKLPGRTDNEIKNVWHTHLKKKLTAKSNQPNSDSKKRISKQKITRSNSNSSTITLQSESTSLNNNNNNNFSHDMDTTSASCTTNSSEFSSIIKSEDTEESLNETTPAIDESFWSEAATIEEAMPASSQSLTISSNELLLFNSEENFSSNFDDGMDFWYDIFIRTGDSIELPEF